MFEKASEILGFSMTDLCFDPAQTDRPNITEYTQPAMVTASLAMMRVFMERTGIRPDVAAGPSLESILQWRLQALCLTKMPSVPCGREVS